MLPTKTACLLVGVLWHACGHAAELGWDGQLHGFMSQSLVHTSDNDIGGDSDDGLAWDMREIGVNLSWRPNPDWLLSGQALARWAGESDAGDLRLDYGFIDRTLLADSDTSMGVRLGKIKNPYGFHNTTRDVAHTRPGIIMPQSIYLDRSRDFFLAAPGISLYGNHEAAEGNFSWQISALRPEVDDPDITMFMLGRDLGSFQGKNSWLSQFMLESAGGKWRAALSLGEMSMKYQPTGAAGDYTAGQTRLPTWVLSLEHNQEFWSFTGEYSQTQVRSSGYGPLAANLEKDNTTEAWYAQATRRFRDGWNVYLRYDVLAIDKNDPDGVAFEASSFLPAYIRYAKDWSIGVRKDVAGWSWSGEWHHVEGTAWLSPSDTPIAKLVRDWDMFLLQGAWYF